MIYNLILAYLDFKTSAGIDKNQYDTPANPPAISMEISSGKLLSNFALTVLKNIGKWLDYIWTPRVLGIWAWT